MKTRREQHRDNTLEFVQRRGELLNTLLEVHERGERAGLNANFVTLKEGIRVAQFAFERDLHRWLEADRLVGEERRKSVPAEREVA